MLEDITNEVFWGSQLLKIFMMLHKNNGRQSKLWRKIIKKFALFVSPISKTVWKLARLGHFEEIDYWHFEEINLYNLKV